MGQMIYKKTQKDTNPKQEFKIVERLVGDAMIDITITSSEFYLTYTTEPHSTSISSNFPQEDAPQFWKVLLEHLNEKRNLFAKENKFWENELTFIKDRFERECFKKS